jgi:ribosomal protein L40E
MIVCKKCGHRNREGESFCASCGAFLEWNSEHVAEPKPVSEPAPVPQPPASSEPTLLERVKHAVGLEDPQSAGNMGGPRPEPGEPAAASTAASDASPDSSAPAAATPVAAGQGEPGPAPEARLPQAVAPAPAHPRPVRRPEPRPSERNPGDLICGQCGVGNPPSRRFCRRCGASLVEAAVVKTPWWRRIFRSRAAPRAGTRPVSVQPNAGATGLGKLLKLFATTLIALIAIGLVIALAAYPGLRQDLNGRAVNAVRDGERYFLVGNYVAVRPQTARASSEAIGHQAQFLTDPSAGYWAADTAGDPRPAVTLSFAQPTDVDYMVVTSGAGTDFAKMGRPREVIVTYSPNGKSEKLTLTDDPKPARHALHGRQVSSMRLQVLSVYPTEQSTLVAVSELDLFRLQ